MAGNQQLYLFMSDTFIHDKSIISLGTEIEPTICYVTEEMNSYFKYHGKLEDVRDIRLSTLGVQHTGTMQLHFDSATLTTELKNTIKDLTNDQMKSIFNIIEMVAYSQNVATSVIDNDLSTSGFYTGFVQDSLYKSSVTRDHNFTLNGNVEVLTVPAYFLFDFNIGSEDITIKVWLSNKDFEEDYPLGTITDVVFPCDVKYLIEPLKYATVVDTIIDTGSYTFDYLNTDVNKGDHTGLFVYRTRYLTRSSSSNFMPFAVLYQGRRPSTLLIRKAIRDKLEASGYDENTWKAIFPELYVTAYFYLVPMWNNNTPRPERIIRPSIINYTHIGSELTRIFPDLPKDFTERWMEIVMNSWSEMFSISIPDPLNDKHFSIRELHPSYVNHSTTESGYAYMDADAKDFNIQLSRCVATLMGESSEYVFIPTKIDDRTWYSFVVGEIEYYVLSEDGYNL